ncbi:MAG: ribonuclease P protein component [Acidobacteriota bacterium]|jgi:ribonuclease P protein component
MGLGLARERRLRVRGDFDRVFRRGRRLGGRLFTVIALPNGRPDHRLGIAASRKLGGAVVRNRARRLVRESFRRLEPAGGEGFDLVIVAGMDLAGCTQVEVDREFRERLLRLNRGGGARRPAAATAG